MKKELANDRAHLSVSQNDVGNMMGKALGDGIILTSEFIIALVGENICAALEYDNAKLKGQSLSSLTGDSLPKDKLIELLSPGFFDEHQLVLVNSSGGVLSFVMSGFCLGMIADRNDLIFLKFIYNDKLESVLEQFNARNCELDDFIYAASHSLRGPLATLKGLINLLNMPRNTEHDKDFIVKQMRIFADRLDDRLHKLMCFAESDKAMEFSTERLPLRYIAEKLRIDDNADPIIQKIKFTEHLSESMTDVENGQLILSLLQNIKSFFCRKGTKDWEMIFKSDEAFNEFELIANGITISPETQKKLDVVNFGYTEILSDPEFTDLYSAKKIIVKLKGRMQINVLDQRACAHILIPRV